MKHEEIKSHIAPVLAIFCAGDVHNSFDESTNTVWFNIDGKDAYPLLARGGDALTSLNYLANKMLEKKLSETGSNIRVVIDANGFEKKKIDNLKTVAHMMAERARYFKSSIDIDPMSPRDRKIVHEFLSTMSDIKTESVGEGPKRHIVIKYTGGI